MPRRVSGPYGFVGRELRPYLHPRRVADLEAIVRDLVDPDPCQYDHHELCQAHSLHPRPCPHERAKALGLGP